ncbi:pyridoxal 5'-phosphate synthase glutaminase subunit PdxT [Clostridium sp. AF32-12BH]|uniref:pyridoxal 5'-phosphate synthase glutaminase subunit PdxT n=1 Tax=Clostridium sp. AF32-12BH TaxID=2292006 RepID=UPI000E506F69|nr:pyridoxal 5'-phosphate synthase glutaminase subunit PdxT [Clostridium sp. AF32-12BH]RHP45699.1 pyridoxal 5'-phosphate synthase glutaminase subunit PdxT [Clostridium sp. AF32-12BH]
MKIAVLAVQGAFIEHEKKLEVLGAQCIELRKKEDLDAEFDALVLPGGESTVQGKLLRELGMFDILKEKIEDGMPVLATCAGLILLAEHLTNDEHVYFGTLPVSVRRNAYGRQLGSFHTVQEFAGIGKVPMTFIRAPYMEEAGTEVQVLAKVDGHLVAVRYKNQFGMSFHPELDEDSRIHALFLQTVACSMEMKETAMLR